MGKSDGSFRCEHRKRVVIAVWREGSGLGREWGSRAHRRGSRSACRPSPLSFSMRDPAGRPPPPSHQQCPAYRAKTMSSTMRYAYMPTVHALCTHYACAAIFWFQRLRAGICFGVDLKVLVRWCEWASDGVCSRQHFYTFQNVQ
jgi:hypothetical protein